MSTADPMVFIHEAVQDTSAYLAMWANRDESPAPARAAASLALERIGTAIRRLSVLRERLVAEIVVADIQQADLVIADTSTGPVEVDPADMTDAELLVFVADPDVRAELERRLRERRL